MGEALEVAKVLVSPAEKLVDAIQGAIGKAYEPRYRKRLTDAAVYEIERIGQAVRENSDIPITYDKNIVSIDIRDYDAFIKRAESRLAYQELTKQKNIEKVSDIAYSDLEGHPPVTNEPMDQDWVFRFFNSVEDISNEKMQLLWGKLLAKEAIHPGSFSLRTLTTLKNLTEEEAALFQKIVPYLLTCPGDETNTFSDYFLLYSPILNKYNIKFPELMLLGEAGIISVNSQIRAGLALKPNQTGTIRAMGSKKVIKITNIASVDVSASFSSYILTEAGKEFLPVVQSFNCPYPPEDYLIDCIDHMKRQPIEAANSLALNSGGYISISINES